MAPRAGILGGLIAACAILPSAAWSGRIEVQTDARLELAGAAQLLSEAAPPKGFAPLESPYVRALRARLATFKDLPAVRINEEPAMRDFDFGARSQILLRLSPLPDLLERAPVEYALVDHAGGAETLARWLDALREFSRAAGFPALWQREAAALEPAVARFRDEERKQDYLGALEAYAGLPLIGTQTAYLAPLQSSGSNVTSILKDGSMEISSVFGPDPRGDFWSGRVPSTLWHEGAHGVIDGLSDLYADRLAVSSGAPTLMRPGCYGDWNQCAREHLVRAVMIRLIALRLGEAAAREQLAIEGEKTFPCLPALLEKLKIYETRRAEYPTLADYYPRLLEAFPPGNASGATSSPLLSDAQRRRLLRLSRAVFERAKAPEALEAARRVAAAPIEPVAAQPPAGPAQKGMEEFQAGRYAQALRTFEAVLKDSPNDVQLILSRAVVLQALSRKDEALASYDRAVSLSTARDSAVSPQILADALLSRAALLEELGKPDLARRDLTRALAVSPEDWSGREDASRRLKTNGGRRPP